MNVKSNLVEISARSVKMVIMRQKCNIRDFKDDLP